MCRRWNIFLCSIFICILFSILPLPPWPVVCVADISGSQNTTATHLGAQSSSKKVSSCCFYFSIFCSYILSFDFSEATYLGIQQQHLASVCVLFRSGQQQILIEIFPWQQKHGTVTFKLMSFFTFLLRVLIQKETEKCCQAFSSLMGFLPLHSLSALSLKLPRNLSGT